MKTIITVLILLSVLLNLKASEDYNSSTFKDIAKPYLQGKKFNVNKKDIKIKVPKFADNSLQVPIFIDASKIKNAKRLIAFADYNPIPIILDMKSKDILPVFATNIKVAHETPIRVLVLDSNNKWHVNSTIIKSAGGGCDVSSLASENDDFAQRLGQIKGKIYQKKNKNRIKTSIFHPMETGLVFGTLEFYINKILIKEKNKTISTIETTSVISENPRFIFEVPKNKKDISIHFLDNEGNDFKMDLS